MATHRNEYDEKQRAEIRRAPLAALIRVSLEKRAVAADLAHEFIAADDAIRKFVSAIPKESLLYEMFEERLSPQEFRRMLAEHRSAQEYLEIVIASARWVRTHHPDAYDAFVSLLMTTARTAADALEESSIPWHRRSGDRAEGAIADIKKALRCERADGD